MAKFNIFKIDDSKQELFTSNIYSEIKYKNIKISNNEYKVTLSTDLNLGPSCLSWQYILNEYEIDNVVLKKQPKGIIYVIINDNMYVATFGSSYSLVEKYCDRNFAFNIARKFEYEKIKSTSISNPNSNKNKIISSYLDNEYFEYDSGSAYLKIKAKLKLGKDFKAFDKNIEIGTSIKLSSQINSLDSFVEIVSYLDDIKNRDDKTDIPIFQEIKDKNIINSLNEKLKKDIDFDDIKISFSDFDIIGTTEVFYSQASRFKISYKRYSKIVEYLTVEEIKEFCKEKSLEIEDVFFDINVKVDDNEHDYGNYKLIDFIDYTSDDDNAVIIKGKWYRYNNDYIENLHKSLKDLSCEHVSKFDFIESNYNKYIDNLYDKEKNKPEYIGKSQKNVKDALKKIYYKEKYYNQYISDTYHFENGDRSLKPVNGSKIEVDDLYKDATIYAVKIGNSSGKLCYVVDQMDIAMRLIKNKTIEFNKEVKNVTIVLVINKKPKYSLEDSKFDISQIKYLALKNAINNWQKNARLLCFNPKVIIGYNQ